MFEIKLELNERTKKTIRIKYRTHQKEKWNTSEGEPSMNKTAQPSQISPFIINIGIKNSIRDNWNISIYYPQVLFGGWVITAPHIGSMN